MSDFDPHSPLFGDVSFAEVMAITGRSRRTVKRWISDGLLTQFGKGRQATFNEDQVVGVETRMAAAARANHERIRERNRKASAEQNPEIPLT